MSDAETAHPSEAELRKAEPRLRQRLKPVKDRLREPAKEDGLP